MSELSFSVIGMSVHTFAAELWVRPSSCDVTDFHEFGLEMTSPCSKLQLFSPNRVLTHRVERYSSGALAIDACGGPSGTFNTVVSIFIHVDLS